MTVRIVPHNPSMEVNQAPLQFRLEGETATSWSSSNPLAVTIDQEGVARSVGGGVSTISATYQHDGTTHVATTNVHSGNLLIYGADGTLYEVPPSVWTARPISPSSEPGIPSFEMMTVNRLQGVYINPPVKRALAEATLGSAAAVAKAKVNVGEANVVYVCYVVDLAAIPVPPPDEK